MKFNTTHIIRIISLILVLSISLSSQAQKVGVVLSGGGASGLAHIGFLKALEENNIPIDYITGTSMGALVGGLYASGYSPDEIEHIFESKEFKVWLSGRIAEEYTDYFKKNQDDASWVRIKFTLDSLLESNLPTNLINSTSLDFGLAQLFSGANAVSNSNFDSLFIPFRCLASDISSKKALAFKDGDLATAIRASISYPFFLNPVNLNGKLLYDGGLYDNFPVTTLCDEFEPDIVLGCNVSYNFSEPDEDNILSQLRSMMSYNTNYKISCKEGFIVEPEVSDLGVLDYKNITSTVYEGYQATSIKIDSIKSFIDDYREVEELEGNRDRFKMNMPEISITHIDVEGLNKSEERYVRNFIRFKEGDSLSFDEAKSKILKLASDEMIRSIYPELEYNENAKSFRLKLKIKKEKKLFISFGGVISTKGINEGFVALQYNYFARNPTTLYANTYFGSFYSSGFGMVKVDVPLGIPLQIHACYTLNKWDYFQNTRVLVGDVSPSYLIQRENFGHLGLSLPVSNKSKLRIGAKSGAVHYEYYQDNDFTRFDTTDETDFNNYHLYASLEKNTLNRKQYANRGSHILFQASMIDGEENTKPGSASPSDSSTSNEQSWIMFKARIDHYFKSRKKMKFGFLLEGVYSEQPFFSNYASTILSSPSFEPTPESKTVFRSKYRAPQYGALGLKGIYTPFKNFDVRLETYLFQPFKQIEVAADYKAKYDVSSDKRYFIGSFTLNYNLAFTQVAVNVNYYDNLNESFPTGESENFTIMLHLGFILFNKKMLE